MKKISIIIPCYNSCITLDRCLESVLNQTYKNIEIIVVDDGSTDDTESKMKRYCENNQNIKYFKLPHGGVARARNYGLEKAVGDYIVFMDSDDNFLSYNALEITAKALEENNVDMVVFNFTHPSFEQYLEPGLYDLTDTNTLLKYYQDFFSSMQTWNKLIKREVITEYFDERISFGENEIFNLANLINVKSVYVIGDVFYNYYSAPREDSKTRVSAVDQSFSGDDFTATKNTIWYRGINNYDARNSILEKSFPDLASQMHSIRIFDFFFRDLEFIGHINADEKTLTAELSRIFEEKEFLFSLNFKENFGLQLKSISPSAIKTFAGLALDSYHKIKSREDKINTYYVLLSIFGKIFYDYDIKSLNRVDVLADAIANFELTNSKESIFTRNILSGVDI